MRNCQSRTHLFQRFQKHVGRRGWQLAFVELRRREREAVETEELLHHQRELVRQVGGLRVALRVGTCGRTGDVRRVEHRDCRRRTG